MSLCVMSSSLGCHAVEGVSQCFPLPLLSRYGYGGEGVQSCAQYSMAWRNGDAEE